MKRKCLDRDVWWKYNKFEDVQYYQIRVDMEDFHGWVGLIQLNDGTYHYWDFPKAGKTAVIGKGMTWLQMIPDGQKRVITAIYLPDQALSVCYTDVIESIEYDTDGVLVYIDKYLDVIFTPQGDTAIDDRDELEDAFRSGKLSKGQYDAAIKECDSILSELCSDISATSRRFSKILHYVNEKIRKGEEKPFAKQ
jgi:predicted RNA-binding protein associated with RNAse of E/G family